jgi:glucokinase
VAVALTGDQNAQEIWDKSIRALAAAIASLINLFDPEIVLLGGGITRAGDALLNPLKEWMNRFEWRPDGTATPINLATLGEMAGAYGAARNAWLARQSKD